MSSAAVVAGTVVSVAGGSVSEFKGASVVMGGSVSESGGSVSITAGVSDVSVTSGGVPFWQPQSAINVASSKIVNNTFFI